MMRLGGRTRESIMNPIDVVDVGQSLDAAEPITSKQNGEASRVGPLPELRVVPMIRKAQVSVFRCTETGTGVLLGARVKNLGTVPLEIDRMAFEYRFEDPDASHSAWGRVIREIGAGVELLPRHETGKGPLLPGEEREYYLSQPMSDHSVLIAEGLTPPRFWIAAYSGIGEVGRAGGELIQRILDPSRITVNRRAAPFFDNMPESVRLTVLEAIAPLRGVDPGKWPSAGAKPLEGVPMTFVVRAAEDPIVLVAPAEDEGVEIVDLVRKGSLEQFRKEMGGIDSYERR